MALSRRSPDRGWWMKPDPAGQKAATDFRVLGRADGHTWLELRPLTGRTHQLRVHCAAGGFPILGDAVYGTARRFAGPMLHLHARAVGVPLDPRRPAIGAEAPPPGHMAGILRLMGFSDPRPLPPAPPAS
jgi:tRNA pseudouridine32 synthase/23S rRNA pseudouridine746 synthase